uniref:Formin GTPase-binding domain-containing protein n=1 Tax=Acrobeloides nanus TaxID=290746 RepID=A0A914DGZ7_9BILA
MTDNVQPYRRIREFRVFVSIHRSIQLAAQLLNRGQFVKEKAQQSATCDNFLQVLEEYARTFPEKYSLPLASQNLEALSISLRTESFSYVQRFLEQNGVDYLTTILHRSRNGGGGELVAIPILSCFKALLNSTAGRACVLDSSDALLAITGALDLHNPRCKQKNFRL